MGAVLLLAACSGAEVPVVAASPPLAASPAAESAPIPAGDASVEAAAMVADEVRTRVLGGEPSELLATAFTGRALEVERRIAGELRRRGRRLEERSLRRRAVHLDSGGRTVVLEIACEQRWITADGAGNWSASLRQWRVTLEPAGGRWLVSAAGDLPPPQWWSPPA